MTKSKYTVAGNEI